MSFLKNKLIDIAIEARNFSHSPYSTKKIGSAIQLDNGKIYSGCNIENASYGGTVCAERVAIWKAYSENSLPIKIKSVAVSSDENSPWPPCGFCRQVIAEFATPDTEIILVNLEKKEVTMKFAELFPFAFESKHLGK